MRRAERVVHVDVAQRGQPLREAGIVLLFFGVEAQVLEQHDAAGGCAAHGGLGRGTDAVFGKRNGAAEQLTRYARRPGGGSCPGFGLPLGRPRCDARITHPAPASSAYLIVGSDSRMRVSSPMTPSLSGTLKSTRMNTRRPFRLRSRIVRLATVGSVQVPGSTELYRARAPTIWRSRSTQRLE